MERNQQQSKARLSGSVLADPELSANSLPNCSHIYKNGRLCRQPVARPGEILCSTHLRSYALAAPPADPLADLADELGEISEIHQVGTFIAKLMKLACRGRITFRRAVSLTYMANSLINAIRLQRAEEVRSAKDDPSQFQFDLTGFPRPDRSGQRDLNQQPLRVSGSVLADPEVKTDTLHVPVPA